MDLLLEKEIRQRRRVEAIYNKSVEDFPTKLEFDDYLEEREDIIFRLVNGVDVKETELQIRNYERENRDIIAANEAKKIEEARRRVAGISATSAPNSEAPAEAEVTGSYEQTPGGQGLQYKAGGGGLPGGLPAGTGPQPSPLMAVEEDEEGRFTVAAQIE